MREIVLRYAVLRSFCLGILLMLASQVKAFDTGGVLPSVYTGNWLNSATGEWELGLYEQFAVYDTDFWDYKKIGEGKKYVSLVLTRDGREVELRLRKDKRGVTEIARGTGKYQKYHSAPKGMLSYPVKDTVSFKCYRYSPDSVTILGYYRNMDKLPVEQRRKVVTFSVDDFLMDKQQEFYTDIDSLGCFRIKVPVTGLMHVGLDWDFSKKSIYAEPGETVLFCADALDLQKANQLKPGEEYWSYDRDMLFMGKNARLHNEVAHLPYVSGRYWRDLGTMKLSDMEVLKLLEDDYHKRLNLLEKYPGLSDRCVSLERKNALYLFASSAMSYQFNLVFFQKRTVFDAGYMEYVERTFPMDCEWYYLTDWRFASFVRDYLSYMENLSGRFVDGLIHNTSPVQPMDVIKYMSSEKTGSPEDLLLIDDFLNSNERLKIIRDSSEKAMLLEKNRELFEKIYDFRNKPEFSDIENLLMVKHVKAEYDTLLPTPYLQELQLGKYCMEMLEQQRQPLSGRLMSFLEENVSTPGIVRRVTDANEVYRKLANKEITYLESLKSSAHLKEYTDAKALFEELTEPYRGNVIYLDIWGTWCGPCREQMAYTGGVKEALKGEKVVYLYLANNSPEQSWKSLIREFDLTGGNVVHYRLPDEQQAMLERMLGISSFPTFMLLDKKGNIVNPKAPRPEQKDMLVDEIRKLLKQE